MPREIISVSVGQCGNQVGLVILPHSAFVVGDLLINDPFH
jgi:hypothetical protein